MKKIAFYLPQYHSIPENDKWWGQGFTEWTNVKKAKPIFKGHCQPEVPLNQNYYCLLDPETQEKQSELALKYGLDGFCYYHYWFEGKMLLEKPMEAMFANQNVKIPFCICWANETWARTWDGREKDILIKQNYNEDETGWKKHFDYFLKFFKDPRYILDEGRPMLIIYKPYLILNCKNMVAYWRKLAKEAGFKDLYVGYQFPECFDHDMDSLGFDFGIEFEPFYTMHEFHAKYTSTKLKKVTYGLTHPAFAFKKIGGKFGLTSHVEDYDKTWKTILKRVPKEQNVFPGAFPSWDNTPRKGKKALVFWEATPEKFNKYFKEQVTHSEEDRHAKYLFINAWNEWGEGAHLEPDEKNGYGYLEAISCK